MAFNGKLTVFIGLDSRESVATDVAAHSIRRRTRIEPKIVYLDHKQLRKEGYFKRKWIINESGDMTDFIDGMTFSTEYSQTRFLIPALMRFQGWALYMDADMIFQSDYLKLIPFINEELALLCVKHSMQPPQNYSHLEGRMRYQYPRKNWSSFMLINCSHPQNLNLTIDYVNHAYTQTLHGFNWLDEKYVGSLPDSYNYISGVSKGTEKDVIHYTEGGPWSSRKDVQYADLWINEYEEWSREADHGIINALPRTIYDRKDKERRKNDNHDSLCNAK